MELYQHRLSFSTSVLIFWGAMNVKERESSSAIPTRLKHVQYPSTAAVGLDQSLFRCMLISYLRCLISWLHAQTSVLRTKHIPEVTFLRQQLSDEEAVELARRD